MAGVRAEVKLTQCNDIGTILNSIADLEINGDAQLLNSLKIAQLSLKHRMNKS